MKEAEQKKDGKKTAWGNEHNTKQLIKEKFIDINYLSDLFRKLNSFSVFNV